ncbi:hypothetical protein [Pseudoalteromonas phage J2-1_QLiu-2017]|nr:hypothetical protein [Pseudoalteromonas phage J2-1_QLiu-2017]
MTNFLEKYQTLPKRDKSGLIVIVLRETQETVKRVKSVSAATRWIYETVMKEQFEQ